MNADVERYLKTLRRIPAEVRQSMATREFEMGFSSRCVCGWAIRDAVLAATGDETAPSYGEAVPKCVERFGGTRDEWFEIFAGVTPLLATQSRIPYERAFPAIEEAFAIAVSETVAVPRAPNA